MAWLTFFNVRLSYLGLKTMKTLSRLHLCKNDAKLAQMFRP